MALNKMLQKYKAENIVEGLELTKDLSNCKEIVANILNNAPIEIADTISKDEVESLIKEIKKGTADNNKIARFLSIINQLGIIIP
jgi:hypothetical protein